MFLRELNMPSGLYIRTESPIAELAVGLNGVIVAKETWEAHRQLAETIHKKIDELLKRASISFAQLDAIAVYEGPGSFTGLRIGISVANAFGYSLGIPVYPQSDSSWLQSVIVKRDAEFIPVQPVYGAQPHITEQKK